MRYIYRSNEPWEVDEEPILKFRLTYEGVLFASQPSKDFCPKGDCPIKAQSRQVKMADHKQELRKHFHQQLKQIWETNPVLKDLKVMSGHPLASHRPISDSRAYLGGELNLHIKDHLADRYGQFGYKFCPMVIEDFKLLCSLDILFLRRDVPGNALEKGDLDNRIKTLIDGLKKPKSKRALGKYETPSEGEEPFFVLLEDDSMVSGFSVETDQLFDPPIIKDGRVVDNDDNRVRVVITVTLRPYEATFFNLSFV